MAAYGNRFFQTGYNNAIRCLGSGAFFENIGVFYIANGMIYGAVIFRNSVLGRSLLCRVIGIFERKEKRDGAEWALQGLAVDEF
ncbi:hypothetical protein Zmor_009444 [Zophobas morio]|uniref:Uncharacterized protein n=1 Tax=Zophobas morio TaxID=2755281 RepID=A0AA38IPB0_9CUCU|nr:hypothetical protein Zmor_009444 [Zophobas morio]